MQSGTRRTIQISLEVIKVLCLVDLYEEPWFKVVTPTAGSHTG